MAAGRPLQHLLLPFAAALASTCGDIKDCSSCAMSTELGVECFWCAGKCYGAVGSHPSSCEKDGCVSDYSMSSCTGICPEDRRIPAGFSVRAAQCMLAASNASYCESRSASYKCAPTFAGIGLELVGGILFSNATTYDAGGVSTHGNTVVVSFRGTEPSWSNLVQDLQSIAKVPISTVPGMTGVPGNAHVGKGFYDSYLSMQVAFHDRLKEAITLTNCTNSERKLYITGHSLGGAIALLAAMDLRFSALTKAIWSAFGSVSVYVYESPRAGDSDFASAFRSVTKDAWTVENYFDDIPHLPPYKAGFEHIQSIVLVGPHPGEIRHIASDSKNDAHTSTSHDPVYYHEEDSVRLQLDGLAGAGPGSGAATCAALGGSNMRVYT